MSEFDIAPLLRERWPRLVPVPPAPWMLAVIPWLNGKPRDDWSADDWKLYAIHLEESGRSMCDRLNAAEDELCALRVKVARGRGRSIAEEMAAMRRGEAATVRMGRGALRRRREAGRPVNADVHRIAQEAYLLRMKMASGRGRHVSNIDALREWHRQAGHRTSRATEDKPVLERMRRIHTQTRKSRGT